jgi:type II secretory pathway pseudopilin PulG
VILLEVLAAVAILGIAGLALVELTATGVRATADARAREREVADADRLLSAYTLLSRPELDQRLGDRSVGPYVVNIQRPERGLYRIAIGDLITVVYRADSVNAP